MRKIEAALDALFLGLYQIISCMVIYFIAWMLLKILGGFAEIGYLATAVIYAVIPGIGVGVLLCIYAYQTTYRAAYFNLSESLLSSVLAIVGHLLITAVFRYTPLIGGAALPLSGLLSVGADYTSVQAQAMIPGFLPMIMFVCLMIVYHGLMLLVRKIAFSKRLKDRYELTGQI